MRFVDRSLDCVLLLRESVSCDQRVIWLEAEVDLAHLLEAAEQQLGEVDGTLPRAGLLVEREMLDLAASDQFAFADEGIGGLLLLNRFEAAR